MRIGPTTLETIRQHFLLSDVVGAKVALKQRGKEHTGLCPFHQEKSPSFTVNNEKQFFHCFGCHAHGDVIGFVMQSERLTFADAVELLAKKAGITLKAPSKAELTRERVQKDLYQALDAARVWYQSQLFGAGGAPARDYLHQRGIDDEIIRCYGIGWAPNQRHGLAETLKIQGFSLDHLVEAGLVIRHDDGSHHDRFRSRVMFPITDITKRVIAFGGRIFTPTGAPSIDAPKYLNSPETTLFHKSKVLYGESIAVPAIRTQQCAIVSEGYLDVIALQTAGLTHSVATLGTAVTDAHLARLWRLAPEIIVCMDGDRAGQAAAMKVAIQTLPLLTPKHSIHFVILPEGQDPDDILRRQGAAALTQLLSQKLSLAEMLWRHQSEMIADSSPDATAALETALMHYADQLSAPALKRAYRHYFYAQLRSRRLTAVSVHKSQMPHKTQIQDKRPVTITASAVATLDEREHLEHGMLALVTFTPTLLTRHDILDQLMQTELSTKELDRARSIILDKVASPSFSAETLCLAEGLEADGLEHLVAYWRQLEVGWKSLPTEELWWLYHDKWVLCYLKAEYAHASCHQENQQDEPQLTRLHALHQEIKQLQVKITTRLAALQSDDI
jgi:DNA primase